MFYRYASISDILGYKINGKLISNNEDINKDLVIYLNRVRFSPT